MTQDSHEEVEFFAEIRRVLEDAGGGDTHFYRLQQSIPAETLRSMTAWLRTLPPGLGEAELTARAQAWYRASRWSEGEGPPPAP